MPTALLAGAGWIKDATGSFNGGLIVIAATQIIGAIAILCIDYDNAAEKVAQRRLAAE